MQNTFIVLKTWVGPSEISERAVKVLKEGSVSVCSLCTQPLMGKARFQEKKEPCSPSFVHSPQGRVSRACPIDSLFPMGA